MDQLDKKDNSQKVELYVSHQNEDTGEISLVNVFYNMAARKKVFLRLIAIFLILGLIIPMFMAETSRKAPDAKAVVKITYEIETEKEYIKLSFPSSVLSEAIANTNLSSSLSISNLERNIKMEQLLTEEVRQRIEVLQEQVKASGSAVGQAANIKLDYENTYIVTLSNGFGSADSSTKQYLTSTEISDLLNNIIKAHKNYLFITYADYDLPEGDITEAASDELDYLEGLDIIKTVMNSFKEYCDKKAKEHPEYTSPTNGLTFSDLSDTIATFSDVDINFLSAMLLSGGVSKSPADLLSRLNYSLRNTRLELAQTLANISSNQKIIDEFRNESISVTGKDGQESQSTKITTEYYNDLVLSQVELYQQRAKLEESIAELESRVEAFGVDVAPESLDKAEAEFKKVYANAESVYHLVLDYAEEFINSDTIVNGFAHATAAQTESDSFFSSRNIKKAVIGGVAGVFIACCLWVAAGFADEMKKGGRANA